jgi:UbiD family decarboxylase
MFMDFREFVGKLDTEGLLVRIKKPVDTKYEISTIVKMLDGRPVIFENVKGFSMPVVSNICSTRDLVSLGIGVDKKELIQRLAHAIDNPKQPNVVEAHDYEELPLDLAKLPILTYYPKDGGPYIASGIAVAKDKEYGINASYHRAMVLGKDRLVLRILERHLNEYMKRGLKEFAFCIGNPTTVMIGASISAELGKNELAIANALSETDVTELDGHIVPQSEIVMICEFTDEQADEGPFLDLTETFDIVRKQSVARVKKIYGRKGVMFHALLPGDLEHKILMGMPREPTIFREVSKVCECLDVYVTPGGCSWLHGAVKIRKRSEEDGVKAIEAAMKGHASMKHVFVVDEDINIEDPREIEWAMATRFQGHKDMVIKTREKGSSLDPSSDMQTRETTKVGFDLTHPLKTTGKDFRRPELPMKIKLEDYLED